MTPRQGVSQPPVRIWNMWDEGKVQQVGAIGTVLLFVLLSITILIGVVSFGRSAHIQEAAEIALSRSRLFLPRPSLFRRFDERRRNIETGADQLLEILAG